MGRLINTKAVKAYALECAANRHHKFTRVSNEFLVRMDNVLRSKILEHVKSMPSVGKTIE